jgi:N-acetylglutamate synthase-like GNAT family acetyltransferase
VAIIIRSARADDEYAIRLIVRAAWFNPVGLDWRNFMVVDDGWQLIGVGQVRPHRDGSRELASLAVVPEYQEHGVASAIVGGLLKQEHGAIHLICLERQIPFYARFGFQRVERSAMPPYFWRMDRLINALLWLVRRPERLAVLRRDPS